MTDKKELKQEELKEVNGGLDPQQIYDRHLLDDLIEREWTHKIDQSEVGNYIRDYLLLVKNYNEGRFFMGYIWSSNVVPNTCGHDYIGDVSVTNNHNCDDLVGGKTKIRYKDYTIYSRK